MEKLVHQARLPHSCFADDSHHLTVTLAGELLRAEELLELDVAADKARQAAPGSGLEPSSRGTDACHFVDLHRLDKPLHRHRPKGPDGDMAFG